MMPNPHHTAATITQRFDNAAITYDRAASVQQRVAQQLFEHYLSGLKRSPNTIVEAGCGTGFLTQHLCQHFPDVALLAVDIAPSMVNLCRHRLAHYPQLQCQIADAEHLQLDEKTDVDLDVNHDVNLDVDLGVDLLISSLCLQWFSDWRTGLARWAQQARTIAFSVPVAGSFSAWAAAHTRAGQQDGLQPLPDAQAVRNHCAQLGTLRHFSIQSEILHHADALDFARTLRALGAHQPRAQHRPANLRRVLRELPQGIDVEYRVAYCIMECP